MHMVLSRTEAAMALATERLVVQISPEDKKRVEEKAKPYGSTAEYVRQAALNYDTEEAAAEAELAQLVAVFEDLHTRTVDQLDRTEAALDAMLRHFGRSG